MVRRLVAGLLACLVGTGVTKAQTAVPADNPGLPVVEPSDGSAPGSRLYFHSEYLMWWLREGRVPPILTTSSFASGGRLGQPDTRVLFGDDRLETRHGDRFIGTRLTAGYWLDEEQTLGIEGSGFFLERDSTHFLVSSGGAELLARPFFNAQTGASSSTIIAGPIADGLRTGSFNGYSRIELFGQEANVVLQLDSCPAWRLEMLAGARLLQMRDRLDLTATGRLLPDLTTLFGLTDHYRVHNEFYGGQTGLRGEYTHGRWFLNLRGETALGADLQRVRTFGDRLFQTPQVRQVQPFGLTVLPSNQGTFHNSDLDFVFEVGANVGYQLTSHIRAFAGYTFLGWLNPIRAGDQVDLVVNPSQIAGPLAGPARPAVPFKEDLFWAQGANVGLEFAW